MEETKELNIKNQTYYFLDDMIDIKNFHSNLLKISKKPYKDVNIYYIGYITIKKFSDCKNIHRGMKLLEHAFELYEKVLDGCLLEVIDIDKMQYGFMAGRGTANAVVVLRRPIKKFRNKNKKLFFIFVHLGKAFDWVPRKVICFVLRQKGVPEYLINMIKSLYKGCETAITVDGELSSSFSLKVGVHQGSTLSPLLFIMVMDVLIEDVRNGSLIELLYADDLLFCVGNHKMRLCTSMGDRKMQWKERV